MKKINIFDYLYMIIGIPWLFFMIITSGSFTILKTVLLIMLSLISIIEILVCNKKLPKKITNYIIIFIIYFSFSIVLGIYNGFSWEHSSGFSLIQIYILTPIIVLILFMIFYKNNRRISYLFNYLKWITLILLLLDVGRFLSEKNIISNFPIFHIVEVYTDSSVNVIAFRITNESSLMFLLPFYISLYFADKNHKRINAIIYITIICLGLFYSFLSGRKALEIVVIISIIIMLAYNLSLTSKKKMYKTISFISISLILFFLLSQTGAILSNENIINDIIFTLKKGLSNSAEGMISRKDNMSALLEMWKESLIFGFGANSYAANSIANITSKWSYEIVYIAMLAQTGLVGVAIFFTGILSILKKLFYKYKSSGNCIFLSVMLGFGSFVVCGATNPLIYFVWPWTITLVVSEIKTSQCNN